MGPFLRSGRIASWCDVRQADRWEQFACRGESAESFNLRCPGLLDEEDNFGHQQNAHVVVGERRQIVHAWTFQDTPKIARRGNLLTTHASRDKEQIFFESECLFQNYFSPLTSP